jgi:hypothetical protein
MPSGAGIAFTLLSLLFAWLLWQSRGGAERDGEPRWRLRLRSLIPPILLAALLPSGCASERFDSLRLFAGGMTVTETSMQGGRQPALAVPGCESYFRPGDQPVFVVGRARPCVDLVVPEPGGRDVDGAVVRLDHRAGGRPQLRMATVASAGGTLVAARDEGDRRIYSGSLGIEDGDQICIRRCTAANAEWWSFAADGTLRKAAGGDDVRQMTLRPGPYGWVRPYGPSDRIHRLSQLVCELPGPDGSCENPALADPPRPGQQGPPALSFLFQEGGVGGAGWRAMLLDPGAQLKRRDGKIVRPNLAEAVPLPEGGAIHAAVMGIRGNALREVRSFTISHDLVTEPNAQRRFRLTLDTPEMVPIGQCSQPLSRLAVTPDLLSPEAFSLSSFGNRPGSVLASAAAGMPIERFDLCRSTRFAFAAPLDPAEGEAAGAPVRRQVDFSVDRMGIPWLLVLLAFAMATIVHMASESLWDHRPLDGILLALLQYLLVVRAIIGIEGVFNDPALDWRLIYSDIGTAMVTLPTILIAVRGPAETHRVTLLSMGVLLILAMAALWWWLGRPDLISQFLAVLALASLAVRAVTLGRRSALADEEAGAPAAQEEPDWTQAAVAAIRGAPVAPAPTAPPITAKAEGSRRFGWLKTPVLDRAPTFWPILLAVIVGARILLGLLGYRERVFGIALSAVYVPLLLVAVAAIVAQAEAAPTAARRRLAFYFLGALAVGAGVVALVINDIGFALVHVPPIAGVALWRLREWRRQAPEGERPDRIGLLAWAAPAAGLVIGYFALWAFVAATPPPSESAPLEDRVAYAVDERSTDPNWLRLRAVFAPGHIAQIGNRAAAIQLDQSVLLDDLTGNLLGRGWLAPVDLGTFRWQATHLSDYLSASHLMAPFGRLGALALLLVLAAAAGAAVSRRVPAPAPWPRLAGALAVWTLFGAAAYMVLANLLLVPFTGRNIYLLAASSGGDLMEGLGLVLMARIGLAYGRSG